MQKFLPVRQSKKRDGREQQETPPKAWQGGLLLQQPTTHNKS
jgi:hypothetical protein